MLTLDWTPRPIPEWRGLLRKAPKANWLQTITLAKVLRDHLGKHSRFGAILYNGDVVGIATVQEVKIGPIQLVELFRGPVWLTENPPDEWLGKFAELFAKEYPRRLLRIRRWLPEWGFSDRAIDFMRKAGFRQKAKYYQTAWINLRRPLEDIEASLDRRWRNSLRRGTKSNFDIRIDRNGSSADAFADYHSQEQKRKGYRARTKDFLRDEIKAAATFRESLILWALVDEEPVAGVLILIHGHCASYRAGWTIGLGRRHNAHNVLLWDAITMTREAGYHYFDVGGTVSGKEGEGINRFKLAMGGELFQTMGVFS